jgi:hypothetical protein
VEDRQRYRDGARPGQSGLPRWPAAVALLAVGALYGVLSDGLTLGPRAFLLGLVAVLLVPSLTAHVRGSHRLARGFAFGVIGLVTLAVATSNDLRRLVLGDRWRRAGAAAPGRAR